MRRSSTVTLTMLPLLATAAVAAADPPERATFSPPGMTEAAEPELSPPGMTPHIWELECDEDPNWRLRPDCVRQQTGYSGGVLRGGFGGYFLSGSSGSNGGSRGGSSGGSRGSSGG